MIREDGNVIYASFTRAELALELSANTDLVFQDDYLAVFRITLEIGSQPVLMRHIVVAADESQ